MEKKHFYEKLLFPVPETKKERETREQENSREITDSEEIKTFLIKIFEEEKVRRKSLAKFEEDRENEVTYFGDWAMKAKTAKDLSRIEALILNRIHLLDTIHKFKAIRKRLKGLLKMVQAQLRGKLIEEKNVQAIAEPESKDEPVAPASIDDILNSMFSINDIELKVLKGNLEGKSDYLSLVYVGTKTKLFAQLRNLRVEGKIDRKEIANVFSKCVKWNKTHHNTTAKSLGRDEIYNKI
jgi:hypothetical protein